MDFYVILGLERGASLNDIKRAYKRLARKCHPDINPGDRLAAAQFRQVAEAYETLSDPDRRSQYDALGRIARSTDEATFGFEGFDFSVSVSGASAPTFGDLFAEVLQSRDSRRDDGAPQRGADLHQSTAVTFEEAMRGGHRVFTVMRQESCRACDGTGVLNVADSRCLHCHGSGIIKSARGHMVFSKSCMQCGGTGRQRQQLCAACGGQQAVMRSEQVTLNIPPGLGDGAQIRIPGKGHVGRNGGPVGDLYVTIRVDEHPLFRREGDDLHITVPIAVHEAALGGKIDVPSLEGTARLRVPPGTQSGQRFRLRERGVPSPKGGPRGDLVVEVRLVLPRALDERSKELLKEFGEINREDVRRDITKS